MRCYFLEERKLKKYKFRPHVTVFIIIVAFLCIVQQTILHFFPDSTCFFCGDCSPCSNPSDIQWIEANAEIELPESARGIHAHTEGFRELFTFTRFTIDSKDYRVFLLSTHCSTEPEQLDPTLMPTQTSYYSQYSWWNPSSAKTIYECSGSTEHFYQVVRIDMSDDDSFTIYVSGSMR
jgi:hypothetical protein